MFRLSLPCQYVSRIVSRIASCPYGIRPSTDEVWKYGSLKLAAHSRSYGSFFYEKCLPMTKIHRSFLQKRKKMQMRRRRKPSSYVLPKTKMMHNKGIKPSSYIPLLLKQETRLDVIMARLHFTETVPQARQPISHRNVCVNNGLLNITPSFKVSHGDIMSFKRMPSE